MTGRTGPARPCVALACAALALAVPLRTLATEPGPPAQPEVAFPEGFRSWAHVKSALVWPETPRTAAFSGLHNIYANPPALTGYRTGRFPEGSVIVFDLFDVDQVEGGLEPAGRKAVDVMVRNPAIAGGWTYQRFLGGDPSRPAGDRTRAVCLACHLREADGDGVFSRFVG